MGERTAAAFGTAHEGVEHVREGVQGAEVAIGVADQALATSEHLLAEADRGLDLAAHGIEVAEHGADVGWRLVKVGGGLAAVALVTAAGVALAMVVRRRRQPTSESHAAPHQTPAHQPGGRGPASAQSTHVDDATDPGPQPEPA